MVTREEMLYVIEPGPAGSLERIVEFFNSPSYGRTMFEANLRLLQRRFDRVRTVLLVESQLFDGVATALLASGKGMDHPIDLQVAGSAPSCKASAAAPAWRDADAVVYQRGIGVLDRMDTGAPQARHPVCGSYSLMELACEACGMGPALRSGTFLIRREPSGPEHTVWVSEIATTFFALPHPALPDQFCAHLRKAATARSMEGEVGRFMRRVSTRLSVPLARWGVHPNAATVTAALVAASACLLFAMGSDAALAAGACLWLASAVLDQVDGELARLQGKESEFGAWLDLTFDRLLDGLALACLAWPLVRGAHAPEASALVAACIVLVATNSYIGLLYDRWMKEARGRAVYFRIGRDSRNFVLVLCALLGLRMEAIALAGALSLLELVRRLLVLQRHETAAGARRRR